MVDQLYLLGPYQWVGLFFGIAYIYYAIKNNPICWVFGMVSCAAIAIEDFTKTQLYADGFLQLFYVGISLVGLYKWKSGGKDHSSLPISSLSSRYHFILIVGGLLLSFAVAAAFTHWTDAAFPILDSMTTVFSVTTTALLVYRIIENWIYWICIDIIYIFLYYSREAPLFSILYVIFCVLAIAGYLAWKQENDSAKG